MSGHDVFTCRKWRCEACREVARAWVQKAIDDGKKPAPVRLPELHTMLRKPV